MLAQEMGVIFTKHVDQITSKCWSEFLQQLEGKGLYVVIETDTNGRVMSPLGGLMPMPCKNETLLILTADDLQQRGLPLGHHIVNTRDKKVANS
ncbi:hypothetical protein T458_17095 [Brevibacillus panacihumi W25]|uniref:Uncharacterized protein n=2 Tax=Brevibacillus panacihumi TaxID=497735 RepID=V6MBD9_9BACL|nr:hypothetical protein [Brevibacillus panacihumi]EST52673.1 hypothetical protein T458_17095 [Brevibacillus panacihumi W25]RNB76011.1 hypothetical protein EDM58_18095 [Brevibacillus panacihumi]